MTVAIKHWCKSRDMRSGNIAYRTMNLGLQRCFWHCRLEIFIGPQNLSDLDSKFYWGNAWYMKVI